jgi:hypothetical protein
MGSRELGALETMDQVLAHLQRLDARDEAIERLIDWIERDRRWLREWLSMRGRGYELYPSAQ